MYRHMAVVRASSRVGAAPRLWLLLSLCFAAAAAPACGGDDSSENRDGGPDAAPGDEDGGPESTELSCVAASGTRLKRILRNHSDRSSEVVGVYDTEFRENCRFVPTGGEVLRCLPTLDGSPFAEGVIRYRDEKCTDRIAQLSGFPIPSSPAYMQERLFTPGPCQLNISLFYELGERLDLTPDTDLFEKQGDSCLPAQLPSKLGFFAITADVPVDRFVQATRTYTESGRIRLPYLAGEDGSRFCEQTEPLIDSDMADHTCEVGLAEDGTTRCLPGESGSILDLFSDDECTTRVPAVFPFECDPEQDYVPQPAEGQCSLRRQVSEIGEPFVAYVEFQETCEPFSTESTQYGIGEVVSPSSFAAFTEERTQVGDRLLRMDFVTEDGLRLTEGTWFDPILDASCRFELFDGDQRCVPIVDPLELTAEVGPTLYVDPVCETPIAVATRDQSCTPGAPRLIRDFLGVYEVGPEQPGPLYFFESGECVADPSDATYYLRGPEVSPLMFVSGTDEIVE
jgi:hypothetical protein